MSIRIAVAAVCLFLLLPGQVSAMNGNQPGKLAVSIAASDSTVFIDRWVSTPSNQPMTIHGIHEIARGETAHVAFIVTGHIRGPNGRARVDVDVCVRRPDGSIAFSEASFARLTGHGSTVRGFVIADPTLEFGLDATDPIGEWRIEAAAHDRTNGANATAGYPIKVLK